MTEGKRVMSHPRVCGLSPTSRAFKNLLSLLLLVFVIESSLLAPSALIAQSPNSGTYIPPAFNCKNANFVWDGNHLSIGKVIGQGVEGVVFDLMHHNGQYSGKVLKMILDEDPQYLYREAMHEVSLSKELPNTFVPTDYKSIYGLSERADKKHYGAFLIKEKVIGYNGYDFLNARMDLATVERAYKSFRLFRDELRKEMVALAKKDVYIWDMHVKNLMYDVFEDQWRLVDANREITANMFEQKLATYLKKADPSHPVHALHRMLTMRDTMTHEEMVDYIINVYFRWLDLEFRKRISEMGSSLRIRTH